MKLGIPQCYNKITIKITIKVEIIMVSIHHMVVAPLHQTMEVTRCILNTHPIILVASHPVHHLLMVE